MRKLIVALSLILALLALYRSAWAFDFKQSCSGRGYLVTSTGTVPLSFVVIQTFHWTEAGAQKFDTLSETLVVNGVSCQYTLDPTQTSVSTINPNGTGSNVVFVVGAVGNPSTCAASLNGHNSFVVTNTGSRFLSTDPGVVTDGDCISAP